MKRKTAEAASPPRRHATSLRLDPKLWLAAQHYALDHGRTLQDLVEEGLRIVIGFKEEKR